MTFLFSFLKIKSSKKSETQTLPFSLQWYHVSSETAKKLHLSPALFFLLVALRLLIWTSSSIKESFSLSLISLWTVKCCFYPTKPPPTCSTSSSSHINSYVILLLHNVWVPLLTSRALAIVFTGSERLVENAVFRLKNFKLTKINTKNVLGITFYGNIFEFTCPLSLLKHLNTPIFQPAVHQE